MTSDPIIAGLSQEMDMLPNDNHIADACTHCHVFLDCIYVKNIWSRSGVTQSGAEWKKVDNKSGGTTLASAHALCLDLLSHVWLCISGGQNCCQKFQRGIV